MTAFFSSVQGSYHYRLAVAPSDGTLYVAVAEEHKIYKLEDSKLVPVVGTGERCVPAGAERENVCGDGGQASDALLDYPKALVVDSHDNIYFSDSRSVRFVSASDGRISTLIGQSHAHATGPPKPLPCAHILRADEIQLQWPTALALDPVDESLYFVDDSMILTLTSDLRVRVVAGRSQLCAASESPSDIATERTFGPIQDISFDSAGVLYVVERNQANRKSAITSIQPSGLAKKLSDRAKVLKSVSSITIGPDASMFVAENTALKIHVLKRPHKLADAANETRAERKDSGDVLVSDHLAGEIYRFNKYGHHLSTFNTESGTLLYAFRYSKNTAFGKLTEISDGLGNRLTLKRDYTNRVQAIENNFGQEFKLQLSRLGHLQALKLDEKRSVTMQYDEETGLIRSKSFSNGDFFAYDYEPSSGRLSRVVLPSGEILAVGAAECPAEADVTSNEVGEAFCVSVRSGEMPGAASDGSDLILAAIGQSGSIDRLGQGKLDEGENQNLGTSSHSSLEGKRA